MSEKVSDVELLAFIWGAVFAGGIWAAVQYAVLWMAWSTPPTVADLVGTLAFAAVATVLLVPSSFILWEIGRGTFAENVAKAKEEGRGR